MAGLDVLTVSSAWGEGFPNVVGEAMACAVPCVVTDVGDSAAIVGDTGRVVPPRDTQALVAGWLHLLDLGAQARRNLGLEARQRIQEHFSLPSVVARYESLYGQVLPHV
jgi:glycosyltransferase involved in cell wall biosynthesis